MDDVIVKYGVIQDLHIVDYLWYTLFIYQDDETVFACKADCRPKVPKVCNLLFTFKN